MMAEVGGMVNVSGQQDRHAVGAAEARQHADDDAEQDADHHQGQIVPGERDLEAADERVDLVHVCLPVVSRAQHRPWSDAKVTVAARLVYIVPKT